MRTKDPYPSGGLRDFYVAEQLLEPLRHQVNGTVKWLPVDGGIAATLRVEGGATGVKFQMLIRDLKPHEPKLQYLHPHGFIRRLCVNAPHRPFHGTHKHKILPDKESAYEPDDIPHAPMDSPVSAELYREILEAFIGECQVSLGPKYKWSSPPK